MRKACEGANEGYCIDCVPGWFMDALVSACVSCPKGYFTPGASESICINCPSGKFQQYEGRAYCEAVKEGDFLSDEPAQVVDSTLSLPSADTASLDLEVVKVVVIAKLAEELGIDPMYIRLEDSAVAALQSRQRRALAGSGLDLKIILLVDDGRAWAAKVAALTSSVFFWAGVNEDLAAKGAQPLDTTGATVETAQISCNENFKYDNASSTCVAVPLTCEMGTYAVPGSGKCIACPLGRFSDTRGAYVCEYCPSNTDTNSIGARSEAECQCVSSWYMNEGVCRPCPYDCNCDMPGLMLETLRSAKGFWRATNNSTEFLPCHDFPSYDSCPGGTFSADRQRDGQCKKGNVGVRCQMCDETNGYIYRAGKRCGQCSAADKRSSLALLISLLLAIVAGGLAFVKVLAHFAGWKTKAEIMQGLRDNFDLRSAKIRILIAFTQVVSRLQVTFHLTYPPIVNDFLTRLDIFEFFNIFHFAFIPSCLYTLDYYDQLAGKVLGPTFVLFVCCFGGKIGKQRWMYEIFLILSFVCYPSFCDGSLSMAFFDCEMYEDGELYLVTYPAIKCTDSKYLSYRYPVAVMGFVLPFGIIALYFVELVGNRRALCPQVSTPEAVSDIELKRIPRAVITIAAAGDGPLQHDHASGRKPSKAVSATLGEFAKTVLTRNKELGITKEELAVRLS
jgi:hypothetical protein